MLPEDARRRYAEELRTKANLRSPAVVDAFARIPREHYLGPGPWLLPLPGGGWLKRLLWRKRATKDADPCRLYIDSPFAIDLDRGANQGMPSFVARCIDELELNAGEKVIHVGAGVGYYTAIIADLVGSTGKVIGIEIDPRLAERARKALEPMRHVEVINQNALDAAIEEADVIFSSAGLAEIPPRWVDALRPNGRLVIPLVVPGPTRNVGDGAMLRVVRRETGYEARFFTSVSIFLCTGSGNEQSIADLRRALQHQDAVRSLRRDPHARDQHCLLHNEQLCLSSAEPARIIMSGGN